MGYHNAHTNYKTTNQNSLKYHIETAHHQYENRTEHKLKSKRINCDVCGRKFNKEETFKKHMNTDHKNSKNSNSSPTITQNNLGRSTIPGEINIKENEVHARATKTRKN